MDAVGSILRSRSGADDEKLTCVFVFTEPILREAIFVGRSANLLTYSSVYSSNGGVSSTGKSEAGGAIANVDGVLDIEDCVFEGNTAITGGAIFFDRSGTAMISSTKFINNVADDSGGAIQSNIKSNVTILSQTVFDQNVAANGGAVAAHDNSNVSFDSTTFTNNKALNSGGAMYIDEDAIVSVSGSTFQSNSAILGGAVYVREKQLLLLQDSNFVLNTASLRGGAFYFESRTNIITSSILCQSNRARSGGCVFWLSYNETSPVYPCEGCTMVNNSVYDTATNTRDVQIMWWPMNITSGVPVLEIPDEVSFYPINSTNTSVSDSQPVWPRLKAVDLYGQIEVLDNDTECSVYGTQNSSENSTGVVTFTPRESISAGFGVISYEQATFFATTFDVQYHLNMSCILPELKHIGFGQSVEMLSCPHGFSTTNKYVLGCSILWAADFVLTLLESVQ